jgi:ankyrin repeat protein
MQLIRRARRALVTCGVCGWVAAIAVGSAAAADTRLVEAVKAGRTDVVVALLKERIDVNAPAGDGSTALHWAVHRDDLATVERLLDARANVNVADDHGVSPLLLACTNGNVALVERLLAAGANPNMATASGHRPLMEGSRTGRTAVVRALIAAGADVNAADPFHGQTALMWAAAHRHPPLVRLLLEHGADVRGRSKVGFSSLMFAAQQGDLETTHVLLNAGAELDARTPDGVSALLIASGSVDGSTSGQFTIVNPSGHEAVALLLLDRGADPNATDAFGITPLHAAVRNDRRELARALLMRGANPNARLLKPRPGIMFGDVDERLWDPGATPLVVAAKAANVELMKLLVAHGADPSLTSTDGTTALMAAAGVARTEGQTMVTPERALEAAMLALRLGNPIDSVRSDGWTALHGAAYNGADVVVRFLAESGATLDVRDKEGRTPLSIAEGAKVKDTIFVVHQSTADLLRSLGARLGLRETSEGR